MVACCSCADTDFEETLNTLKYAHRARNIKNKPVVNHDPKVAQLAALQDENEALRRELRRVSETGLPTPVPTDMSIDTGELQVLRSQAEAAERRVEALAEQLAGAESEGEAAK